MNDDFFRKAVQPFCWFAAFFLFTSYIIGLWFTLRTHAAVIWTTDGDEKKAAPVGTEAPLHDSRPHLANGPSIFASDLQSNSIRESQLYKRILGHSLEQIGLAHEDLGHSFASGALSPQLDPHSHKPQDEQHGLHLRGLTEEDNESLARQVAEVAATAAAVAARDSARAHRRLSTNPQASGRPQAAKASSTQPGPIAEEQEFTGMPVDSTQAGGGHDAPNWSKTKSAVILLGATILYAIIAEILVDTVDVVLDSVDIDEKFLGITLFALVPNTTEFLVRLSIYPNKYPHYEFPADLKTRV